MKYFKPNNIYSLKGVNYSAQEEHVDSLYKNKQIHIKRIVSHGQLTPPDQWYDQSEVEWVVLVQGQASLEFEKGNMVHMEAGDYLKIDAGNRHKITYTSKYPPCIWVAVYINE